jgi:hypothetical protein
VQYLKSLKPMNMGVLGFVAADIMFKMFVIIRQFIHSERSLMVLKSAIKGLTNFRLHFLSDPTVI